MMEMEVTFVFQYYFTSMCHRKFSTLLVFKRTRNKGGFFVGRIGAIGDDHKGCIMQVHKYHVTPIEMLKKNIALSCK